MKSSNRRAFADDINVLAAPMVVATKEGRGIGICVDFHKSSFVYAEIPTAILDEVSQP